MKTKKLNNLAVKIRRLFYLVLTGFLFLPTPVSAADMGGNPLMDSMIVKGLMKFLHDASVFLMVAAPVICGILIGVFSLIMNGQQEAHDKEKWSKNRKSVLISLCWVFGASSIVTIISSYLK